MPSRGRRIKDKTKPKTEADAMAELHARDLRNSATPVHTPVVQDGVEWPDTDPIVVGDEDHDFDELTQLDEDQTGPDSEDDDRREPEPEHWHGFPRPLPSGEDPEREGDEHFANGDDDGR